MDKARGWIVAGVCVDLLGVALIAASLPEGGLRLAVGVSALAVGSFLIVWGTAQRARSAAGRETDRPGPDPSRWRPEPELRQPPPRPVQLNRSGKQTVLLWVLMMVVIPGYVFFAASLAGPDDQHIQQNGLKTTARIHDKLVREGAGGPVYYLRYHFQDEEGTGVRSSVRVSREAYEKQVVGEELEVIYLPGQPLTHSVPGVSEARRAPSALPIALGAAAILLLLLEIVRRRHQQITAHGVAVPGVIEKANRRGRGTAYTLQYTVTGQPIRLRGSDRELALQEGDLLTVLHMPNNPRRALIYRSGMYRAL